MEKLVFATNNSHKLAEVNKLLCNDFEILSLMDIGCKEEIAETSHTLEGNASLKSNYIFKKYHMNCFADDTGLEIEVLEGKPGVWSARYAGNNYDSEANIEKLLTDLQGKHDRRARFRTAISLIFNCKEYFFEGFIKGEIINEKRGKFGFGYDPIFQPNGYLQTFAEMDITTKNKISHRGIVVRELVKFLNRKYDYSEKVLM